MTTIEKPPIRTYRRRVMPPTAEVNFVAICDAVLGPFWLVTNTTGPMAEAGAQLNLIF